MTDTITETTPPPAAARKAPPAALLPVVAAVLVALVVGLFASAFIWPLKASDPQGIPLGLAGSSEQTSQLTEQLDAAKPGLFEITTFNDRDAVVAAIEKRDIDGGLVVGEAGLEMLTASAGGPQIAQVLGQLADGMSQQHVAAAQEAVADAVQAAEAKGASADEVLAIYQAANAQAAAAGVTTTDVVTGGTIAAAGNLVMLPALIGGMGIAMISFFLIRRPLHRMIALFGGAILAGLVGAAVLGPWFEIIPGHYWMHALALGMGILAIGATITGLGSLLGRAGLGIGAVLMMLIGNPWGGMLVPTAFLPGFMGWLGSHMPNGNVITVIQNISFFPAASQAGQWWTFIIWAAIGLALLGVGAVSQARTKSGNAPVTR